MWVPPKEKEKEKKTKQKTKQKKEDGMNISESVREERKKNFNFLSSLLSQIYENLSAGFRRDKHEKCSTRRGLRVSTRNTGFHR